MPKSISITIDQDVLVAARRQAAAQHRSLSRYLEHLVLKDLADPDSPAPTILDPDRAEDLVPFRFEGEDPAKARRRNEVTDALFKAPKG